MLKNYLLTALRNLMRNRVYSLINIVGFALGLSVFLIISLVVIDDLSFDRFHVDSRNIYRFLTQNVSTRNVNAITSGALTKEVMEAVPDVIATTRVFSFGQVNLTFFGAGENEQGIQRFILGADSNFFKVFPSFKIIEGDPDNQLKTPNTAVVTREVARALFGDENPIGKSVSGQNNQFQVTITGIVSDCPRYSHLHYDIIAPALVNPQNAVWWESWDNITGQGYLRTHQGVSQNSLEKQIQDVAELNGMNEQYLPLLQPLLDVHLGSGDIRFDGFNWGKSDKTQVVILSVIALLTLIIASINFINLSSARAIKRAREVGMRKVVGANRIQLMGQYLGESVLLTLIATVIAGITVQLSLPALTNFLGKQVNFTLTNSPILILGLFLTALFVGLLSGIYPAIILAGFKPVSVLKGAFRSSKQGIALRQGLVVFQFALSIALIASVIIVLQQLHYVVTMDRGYDTEQIAVTFMFNQQVAPHRATFMDELRKIPTIEAVGSTIHMPAFNQPGKYEARAEDSISDEMNLSVNFMFVGPDFIPALDLKLIAGRNFTKGSSADSNVSVVANEALVQACGWDDPIGRHVIVQDVNGNMVPKTIIGVVRNFQLFGARQEIEPLVLEYLPQGGGFVPFRIQAGTIPETMEKVREVWTNMFPDVPFNSAFLDDQFEAQYQGDRNFATKVGVFSALAIIIASLGLLGLTSYATEQRRREIAVRKVLGSSEGNIMFILMRDFVKWVLFANIIGWPIAFFAMRQWLSDFVYRITITPLPFIIAGLAALVIAMLTISIQAYNAALTDPATVLRTE
ncbi:MAG: FtsX-like permease family protein [bacterium]